MVEITSEENNKVKRMKSNEDSLRDFLDNVKHTNIEIIGLAEKEKKKGYEKIFEDYSWKFPQHGKGDNQSSPRGPKSPIQGKPKETHTNQTNKD